MLSNEMKQKVRRLFHAERLPVGTIARMLGLHHSTVRRAILHDGVPLVAIPRRSSKLDPFVPFLVDALERYPGCNPASIERRSRRCSMRSTLVSRSGDDSARCRDICRSVADRHALELRPTYEPR